VIHHKGADEATAQQDGLEKTQAAPQRIPSGRGAPPKMPKTILAIGIKHNFRH
jgi:hypothetical protein